MKVFLISVILIFVGGISKSQSLPDQYKALKATHETFKHYKVIPETEIDRFWSITMDSISNLKENLVQSRALIAKKESEVRGITEHMKEQENAMSEMEYDATHISSFGTDFSKVSYIFINSALIVICLIALGFTLFKFNDNNKIARTKVRDYEKLEDSYETYKRKSLEKQMKLRRELQTVQNRLQEIRST